MEEGGALEATLDELRRYRDLRRRRDALIRRAARAGYTRARIAGAVGLSPDRVKQITRRTR